MGTGAHGGMGEQMKMTIEDLERSYTEYLLLNHIEDTPEERATYFHGQDVVGSYEAAIEAYKKDGRACRVMTMLSYPRKMTVEGFYQQLLEAQKPFIQNMHNLGTDIIPKKQYAEDWMETLQKWMEMEKGDFTS